MPAKQPREQGCQDTQPVEGCQFVDKRVDLPLVRESRFSFMVKESALAMAENTKVKFND